MRFETASGLPGRRVRMSVIGLVSRVSPVHTAVRNCTRDEGRSFEVGNQVLISSHRKPLLFEALGSLRLRSCIIDGEAVACGDDGIASFDRIRYRRHDADVFMWAFDLIELNGE
jgi:hypothetical protein